MCLQLPPSILSLLPVFWPPLLLICLPLLAFGGHWVHPNILMLLNTPTGSSGVTLVSEWHPHTTSHQEPSLECPSLAHDIWGISMSSCLYSTASLPCSLYCKPSRAVRRLLRVPWPVRTSNHCEMFSSVQLLSRVRLFAIPWIAACQASLSITISQSSLRLTSINSVMPSSHLILCHPLLLLPPIPPSIRVFSNESTLLMRWPKYWSFSFSIIPSKNTHDWSLL